MNDVATGIGPRVCPAPDQELDAHAAAYRATFIRI
jgi:hypothetical protein